MAEEPSGPKLDLNTAIAQDWYSQWLADERLQQDFPPGSDLYEKRMKLLRDAGIDPGSIEPIDHVGSS